MRCGFSAPVASPKSVSLTCPVLSSRKFCITEFSTRLRRDVHLSYLGLQISMDVPELVQLTDTDEHLTHVKPRDLLLEYACIVEKRPKVSPGHVLHGKIDMLRVLERI